jgi:hypothetical protein
MCWLFFLKMLLSAATGEGREWGRNTERKLKSDHRDGVVSDKLCIISFLLEFYCVLFFITLVSVQYGSLWYYWGVLRWHRWLYNCVTVFCVILQLCWIGHIFRHNRKAFFNNDSFTMLSVRLPSTWNSSAPTAQSRDPTFLISSSLSQLFMLRLVVAACGTKTGLPSELHTCWGPWCLLLGRNIYVVVTTVFWKFKYI